MKLPKQKRSEETRRHILRVAREMSSRRSFDSLSIAELSVKARISIGCFYGHFASKEELGVYLVDRCFVESIIVRTKKEMRKLVRQKAAADVIIRRYISLAAETFAENRNILRSVANTVRTSSNADLKRQIFEANRSIHLSFREALLSCPSHFRHPQPELAIDVAILTVSAALREAILMEQPVSELAPISRLRLVEELTRLFVSYIGADYKSSKAGSAL
jgi:AcrR family transcriptional regulator